MESILLLNQLKYPLKINNNLKQRTHNISHTIIRHVVITTIDLLFDVCFLSEYNPILN